MRTITPVEYTEFLDAGTGWCLECQDFSDAGVGPDSEDEYCEACDSSTVLGLDVAIIEGHVSVLPTQED